MRVCVSGNRLVYACISSLLLTTISCEGAPDDGSSAGQESNQVELGTKVSAQTLKKLARNFRVSATEPLVVLTRAGESVAIPIERLVLQVELAPAPVPAVARRAPVVVAPEIPAVPARRAQPAAFTADVPCTGVATRARVPVTEVTVPEVGPDQVPRAVRVPPLVVVPAAPAMPVVATRVRVPVQSVDVPPPPSASSAAKAAKNNTRKTVVIPEFTIGLLDSNDPAAAMSVEVQVPERSADEAVFERVPVKK
jgi:hypothetical protein